MNGQQPRVVIIGGGFGGLNAAQALRRAPVRVTLIDRRNHHLFQPLLYQVATAALNPSDIASPIRRILRRPEERRGPAGRGRRRSTSPAKTVVLADGDGRLRLPDRRDRRDALVLRPRRVGAVRARA